MTQPLSVRGFCRALILLVTVAAPLSAQPVSVTGRLGLLWGDPLTDAGTEQFSIHLYPEGGEPVH